jgi:4-amino-4-deoxy-L-arabinose transferase-like glycosyltransferase
LSRHSFVGSRLGEILLLAIAACFFILHAVHLRADFPNYSPWMDWSKYTDEGWYGDAAIRHFQRGTWYVPGDFNPAAALPVWPLVESVVFRFTGVSVVAARALAVGIFGLILVSVYLLVRRWQNLASESRHTPSLAPAIAVLLLAVSPFCYAFSRLAILEPMLILLTLLALLATSYICAGRSTDRWRDQLRCAGPVAALGILLPLMVLTKTTAAFLLPCIAWVLFARVGYRLRPFLRLGLPALILATVVWVAYYGLLVRPHFLSDYEYLFTANAYTGITSENAFQVLRDTFTDGMWVGHILYPLALVAAVTALFFSHRLLRNPLIPALLLWVGGYGAFLAYHNNLQPRYYLVVAIPLTILAATVFESLWNRRRLIAPLHHMTAVMSAVALAVVVVSDARQTLGYVAHPEYTFADAADRIRQIVAADRSHNPLVLSISGSDLSLMTGVPSICDDFGTMDLEVRVRAYQPGWYVAWNQVDDDKMDALTPLYHLKRVASFPAMDDPERNLLILYRLDPATSPAPRPRRTKPAPKLLQTSFGQQPNPIQLEH